MVKIILQDIHKYVIQGLFSKKKRVKHSEFKRSLTFFFHLSKPHLNQQDIGQYNKLYQIYRNNQQGFPILVVYLQNKKKLSISYKSFKEKISEFLQKRATDCSSNEVYLSEENYCNRMVFAIQKFMNKGIQQCILTYYGKVRQTGYLKRAIKKIKEQAKTIKKTRK